MIFHSYPHTLLLFFSLSAFARRTWLVHSCLHLTAASLSSRSCGGGGGGLPTRRLSTCDVSCRSRLRIYAAFMCRPHSFIASKDIVEVYMEKIFFTHLK